MEVTSLNHRFANMAQAQARMREVIDRPVEAREEVLEDRLIFSSFTRTLSYGRFTNIYDINFPPQDVRVGIHISDKLEGVYEYIERTPGLIAATSGPFLCHIDQNEGIPYQVALNLAVADNQVKSLPVVDREAVLCVDGTLLARPLRAFGTLIIDDTELTWAGSLTDHRADCRIFGNGNLVVERVSCELNGGKRVIVPRSRFTPAINGRGFVDVGFIPHAESGFIVDAVSDQGGMDICRYAFVGRFSRRYLSRINDERLYISSIDGLTPGRDISGGFTTGPMLDMDFAEHPINQDRSLGPISPLSDHTAARMVLYETTSGRVHIRIFDGRPDSEVFQGVTPMEVLSLLRAEEPIRWGCFLDGGHTARTCIRQNGGIKGYGNAHYLTLPSHSDSLYAWAGKRGRPTAGMIVLGQGHLNDVIR